MASNIGRRNRRLNTDEAPCFRADAAETLERPCSISRMTAVDHAGKRRPRPARNAWFSWRIQ